MSSRRKSTTPCMVLATEVLEHKEVERKTERSNEDEAEEEEGKVKEGAEEGPNSEELDQEVMLIPAPSDAGKMTVLT